MLTDFVILIIFIGSIFCVFSLYGLIELGITIYNTKTNNTKYPRFINNPNE